MDNSKKLLQQCSESLALIAEEIKKASASIPPDEIAWGQFLDFQHAVEQTGVYGTATAVKTLALIGEPQNSDYLQSGLNWLRNSYNDAGSRANGKKDWAVIYKFCYFLEALEPHKQEISPDVSDLFSQLIDRRLEDNGWGEYYFSAGNKDPNGSLIATSMALYVLRRYITFSRATQGENAALWFCKKVLDSPDANAIIIAMAIVAVNDYLRTNNELKENFRLLTDRLEEKVKTITKRGHFLEYQHHFTVEDRETGQSSNRYIFLPINAIVSYALLIAKKYRRNKDYINKVVEQYQKRISINKGYSDPEQAPRKSTPNHYWITLLFQTFSKLSPIGKLGSALLSIKRHSILYWVLLTLVSLGIIIGAFFVIQAFEGHPALNAISAIVVIIADVMINRVLSGLNRKYENY